MSSAPCRLPYRSFSCLPCPCPRDPSRPGVREAFGRKLSDSAFGKGISEMACTPPVSITFVCRTVPSPTYLLDPRLSRVAVLTFFLSLSANFWRGTVDVYPHLKVRRVIWRQPDKSAGVSHFFVPAAKMLIVPVDLFRHSSVTAAGARKTAGISWRDVSRWTTNDATEGGVAHIPPSSTAYAGFPPDKTLCRYAGDLLRAWRALTHRSVCRQRSRCR